MKKRRLTKKEWERRKRIRFLIVTGNAVLLAMIVLGLFCVVLGKLFGISERDVMGSFLPTKRVGEPVIQEMLLTPNPYSRPGDSLIKVKGIVVHYTANPGTDAEANRNYFENLKDTKKTSVSSHFVIDLDGSILQCIPLDEIAYASNNRNSDTVSIECCHEDETGKFTKETYASLVKLTAWLCGEYNLKEEDILRHYDVTGKDCPRYFVANEDQWRDFKKEVFQYIKKFEKGK